MKKSDEKVVIYQTKDGVTSIEVKLEGETVWLSQHQMSELFQTDRTSILRHIKNIYTTEELDENSTCAFFAQVREEGHRIVNRRIPYYNLDMIISVGYDGSKRISNGTLVAHNSQLNANCLRKSVSLTNLNIIS